MSRKGNLRGKYLRFMHTRLKNSIDQLHTVVVRRQDGEQRGQEDGEISNSTRPKRGRYLRDQNAIFSISLKTLNPRPALAKTLLLLGNDGPNNSQGTRAKLVGPAFAPSCSSRLSSCCRAACASHLPPLLRDLIRLNPIVHSLLL
jgi:hypothetical protein